MHPFGEPTRRRSETLRYPAVLYSWLGMVALLLAGLLVPTPGIIAAVAIAGTGLLLVGAQHWIAHRLVARSAELIGKQEALLASFATGARR